MINKVEHSWFREAVIPLKTSMGREYYIQSTTWQDKKHVMFIHTTQSVLWRKHTLWKDMSNTANFACPKIWEDYATYFNAIDCNDCESANFTTTFHTGCWYLCLFFWLFGGVIHVAFIVVCYSSREKKGPPDWDNYLSHKYGRQDFQNGLGIQLMNKAEWTSLEEPHPTLVWQSAFVLCSCGKCFFFQKSFTSGVYCKPESKVVINHYDGTRSKMTTCTNVPVKVRPQGKYCHMFYQSQDPLLSAPEKKRKCNFSYLGCGFCKEPVCGSCWKKGHDSHMKMISSHSNGN